MLCEEKVNEVVLGVLGHLAASLKIGTNRRELVEGQGRARVPARPRPDGVAAGQAGLLPASGP